MNKRLKKKYSYERVANYRIRYSKASDEGWNMPMRLAQALNIPITEKMVDSINMKRCNRYIVRKYNLRDFRLRYKFFNIKEYNRRYPDLAFIYL